jgi:hypothetical protein
LNQAGLPASVVSHAYNRGVDWIVVTSFDELRAYKADLDVPAADECLAFRLHYDAYVDRFDLLWLLSRESAQTGALDQYAGEQFGAAQRRMPIGDHLLSQMVLWREELFKQFWSRNRERGASLAQMDEAIQRLINRLIFIRTCEDRGIEEPRLLPLLQRREDGELDDLWQGLLEVFRELNGTYDSHLFERHLLDILDCAEATFRGIIKSLHYGAGLVHYQFDVISAGVLSHVLEQYLGFVTQTALLAFEPALDRTIELASRRRQYRRHGIHATPQFIVDFAVNTTLRAALDGRSAYESQRMTILDPSCGSGSFLIAAYDWLLDHYSTALQQPDLSQPQRMEVLTRNIYGIDLDAQAVDTTQLNLILRALEIPGQLPNLNRNIKLGNSLIQGRANELEPIFGEQWQALAQPLTWSSAFANVLERGGFDVIIGNPPQVGIQALPEPDRAYYLDRYRTAAADSRVLAMFVEQGWGMLRKGGLLAFALPGEMLDSEAERPLRRLLSEERAVSKIIDFGPTEAFDTAPTRTLLLVLRKDDNREVIYIDASELAGDGSRGLSAEAGLPSAVIPQSELTAGPWALPSTAEPAPDVDY